MSLCLDVCKVRVAGFSLLIGPIKGVHHFDVSGQQVLLCQGGEL
jgi:hypothetical protein